MYTAGKVKLGNRIYLLIERGRQCCQKSGCARENLNDRVGQTESTNVDKYQFTLTTKGV